MPTDVHFRRVHEWGARGWASTWCAPVERGSSGGHLQADPTAATQDFETVAQISGDKRDPTTRAAGQRARMIVQRLRLRTILALGVVAVSTTFAGRELGLRSNLFLACELALLLTIFVVLHFVVPLVERHDRGATGEERVGALLDRLVARGWRVFHDANLGQGDIDHILIGPGGLLTVETKSHPGPVRVGRVHGAIVAQARSQRVKLERLTGLRAEPLIVFSEAWIDRPLARRRGVRVLPSRMLLRYLSELPPVLDEAEIGRVHDLIAAGLLARANEERALGRSRGWTQSGEGVIALRHHAPG